MRNFIICLFLTGCLWSGSAQANPSLESQVAELTKAVHGLQLVVENQAREIAELKAVKSPAGQPSAQVPVSSGSKTIQGRWNPDIGVVGDIVAKLDSGKEDAEGADRLAVRELEIVFGSAVDPYSRFDATLGISDTEEMEIEEAYLTRFALPLDLTARVGRFLPRIGKAIPVHLDSLDTVDEPLVIARYFGHHGYSKSGADISRPIDLPWSLTHEATLGVLEGGNGEEGTLFGDTRRRPTLYSHLKNYIDLTDDQGLEVGFSYLTGSSDEDSEFEVYVLGADATWIWRYADQRHLKLQAEAFRVSRSGSFVETEDPVTGDIYFDDIDDNRNIWGAYLLADWRFDLQWAAGVRLDDVKLISDAIENPESGDKGITGYLTFYQSEFARWRAQVTHLDLASGQDDNRVLLQGTFAIGEHKHNIS